MTGPKMNPPRAYDTIKPLVSSTGDPLTVDVTICSQPGTPCICCRVPCDGYRQSVALSYRDEPEHPDMSAAYLAALERS